MPAPHLVAVSLSSARKLMLPGRCGLFHRFIYCGSDCIAYAYGATRSRLGASAEVWRLAFHEFDCMDWPVVSSDEFDKLLPTLRITA